MRALFVLLGVMICAVQAADTRKNLAPLLEKHLEKRKFPAFAAAVVRGTNIIAAGTVGVRKIGSEERVGLGDKFHIGSCTKSMTALLAAFLDGEGVVQLTNTVGDTLTDWNIPDQAKEISLELLLQNRSGIGNDPDRKLWARAFMDSGAAQAQRKRFLEGFLKSPLEAEPGEKYIYSNVGFGLAGAMLEVAAGESWEDLVQKRIFERLQLKSGGFGPPTKGDAVDQPWGHVWKNGEAEAVPPGDNPIAIAPAGRVHLSILDCARYAAFHLQAAQRKIPELQSYLDDLYEAPEGSSYGMGWIVGKRSWAGGKVLTHAGSNTMFFTVIWIAPEKDFACVVATNLGDRGNLVAGACDEIVGELVKQFVTE